MYPFTRSRKLSVRGVTLLLPSLLAAAGFAVGAVTLLARGVRVAPVEAAAQGAKGRARVESELITLRPTGFEPREITRPAGPFLLVVDNYCGQDSVTLRLTAEAGGRLREVSVPRRQRDWGDVVVLPPGRYALTEANHPEWVCHITIR